MKKIWKILGAAALVGSIPFAVKRNEDSGEISVHALLWNVRLTPDPDDPSASPNVAVNIGSFTNPFTLSTCACGGDCHCHCHDEEEAEEVVEVTEEVTPEDLAD